MFVLTSKIVALISYFQYFTFKIIHSIFKLKKTKLTFCNSMYLNKLYIVYI